MVLVAGAVTLAAGLVVYFLNRAFTPSPVVTPTASTVPTSRL
jgi:hypothetical protein